jgi:hypothetical protein
VIRPVEVAAVVLAIAHDRFGSERSTTGDASEYDFVGGPLAAAVVAFRDFDSLSFDVVAAVRSYTVVDPIFGAVTFVAMLRTDEVVGVVDFADDLDYWTALDADPE